MTRAALLERVVMVAGVAHLHIRALIFEPLRRRHRVRRMARGALGELRRVLRVMRDELMRIDDLPGFGLIHRGKLRQLLKRPMALQAVRLLHIRGGRGAGSRDHSRGNRWRDEHFYPRLRQGYKHKR